MSTLRTRGDGVRVWPEATSEDLLLRRSCLAGSHQSHPHHRRVLGIRAGG